LCFADAHFAAGVTVPLRPVVPNPLKAAGRSWWLVRCHGGFLGSFYDVFIFTRTLRTTQAFF
jgi:hypothetical protein